MSKDNLFLVSGKSPILECNRFDFCKYITTSEEFKTFTSEIVDLEKLEEGEVNTEYRQFVAAFERVILEGESEYEDRAIQGIERLVDTDKGKVKIGFTRVRENRIYVRSEDGFYRGIKVFFADLCLIGAMDFVPLDKSLGNGNIEILEWNKRKSTKKIKFIHNKVQSILYVVDMEFESLEKMQNDMDNPKELNLSAIIEPLL